MQFRTCSFFLFAGLFLAMNSTVALSQVTSAQSQHITPNARAQGMGRAFTAVAEGASVVWWNPGALAMQRTIELTPFSYTKLVPDLADDVWLYAPGAVVDLGPVGFGFNTNFLSYGESTATDGNGKPLGTFTSKERTTSIGAGVELFELLRNLEIDVPHVKLGLGYAWKKFHVDLAPEWATGDGNSGKGSGQNGDFGTIVTGVIPMQEGHLEGSLAIAWKNVYENEGVKYDDINRVESVGSSRTIGGAVKGHFGRSERFGEIFSFVGAYDYYEPFGQHANNAIKHYGLEGTLYGIGSVRLGKIEDPDGNIEGATFGLGATYNRKFEEGEGFLGAKSVGARLDWATVPQAKDLDRVNRLLTLTLWFSK